MECLRQLQWKGACIQWQATRKSLSNLSETSSSLHCAKQYGPRNSSTKVIGSWLYWTKISPIHAIISVFCIREHQYAYSGHVINFPQDIQEFCTRLPRNPQNLTSVLIVRRVHQHRQMMKVMRALQWLKLNNRFFTNIELDMEDMSSLPKNGNVFDWMQSATTVASLAEEKPGDELLSLLLNEHVTVSAVPMVIPSRQKDQIQQVSRKKRHYFKEKNRLPYGVVMCRFIGAQCSSQLAYSFC